MLALLVCLASPAHAGDEGAGTRAAAFLQVSPTPGLQAMGGAGLALDDGLQSANWNTSSLATLRGLGASFSHTTVQDDVQHDWFAVGGPLGRTWRWGANALYRNEGVFEMRDASGSIYGSDVARSTAMAFQLARPIGSWLSVGAGARYVGEHLGKVHGNGLAFDAGARLRAGAFSFAFAGQNFGGGMDWEGQRWRMPATFGAGVAVSDPSSGLRLAVDLVAPANYFRSVRTGLEWRVRDLVAFRAGIRHELGAPEGEHLGGPSFGFGTGWNGMWIDYSLSTGGDEAAEHRVALNLIPRHRTASVAAPAATPFGPPARP